jgi:hypothetical protein
MEEFREMKEKKKKLMGDGWVIMGDHVVVQKCR